MIITDEYRRHCPLGRNASLASAQEARRANSSFEDSSVEVAKKVACFIYIQTTVGPESFALALHLRSGMRSVCTCNVARICFFSSILTKFCIHYILQKFSFFTRWS